jgi:hypothetical protein
MSETTRPPSLGLPFAAVGLVGGILVARAFGAHPFDLDRGGAIVALSTAAVSFRLGQRLGPRLRSASAAAWWPEVIGYTALAGAQNALVLLLAVVLGGVFDHDPDWVLGIFPGSACAAAFGCCMAVPFMPSLLALAAAYRRSLMARPGSVVGDALVRRVWLAVCATVAMHVSVALLLSKRAPLWRVPIGSTEVLGAALGVALAGLALLVLLDAATFVQLRRALCAAAGLQRLEPGEPAAVAEAGAAPCDLGIGEQRYAAIEPGSDPYRAAERARVVLRGQPALALAALAQASWSDAVVLAFALLPLGFVVGVVLGP